MRTSGLFVKEIGLFGGMFNPIHNGHIDVINSASKILEKVWIIPSYQNPLKEISKTSISDRVNMLKLTTMTNHIYDQQLKNKRKYFIDTLKHLYKNWPRLKLVLIVGVDEILTLPKWKDIEQYNQYCSIAVCNRGNKKITTKLQSILSDLQLEWKYFDCSPLYISSSLIRDRIKKGLSISKYVPEKVEEYIKANNLYK